MSGRWRYGVVPIIIAVVWTGMTVLGEPSLEITVPDDESTIVVNECNVTGTAQGSSYEWLQGDQTAFEGGTWDDVVVDPSGRLRLARRVQDSFDDNVLNANIWTTASQSGLTSVEEGKVLHIKGTSSVGTYWMASTIVTSSGGISMFAQAVLASFSGTGTGFSTALILYQDDSNYVGIGELHDQNWGAGVFLYTVSNIGGTYSIDQLASVSSHPHIYRITYVGGTVELLQDNVMIATVSISLSNPKIALSGKARTTGDSIDAQWDSVISDYNSVGTITSSIHDTRSVNPTLTAVAWNMTTPFGTQVHLELRTSPNPDMSTATPWQSVISGQTSGLPDGGRYLQYRARLSTTDPRETPGMTNVTVTYDKPVTRVEVSIDERSTWATAVGKELWWAIVDLPEGASRIWARATDVAGDINETSIAVDVDTTPPEGTVVIDGGASYTAARDVTVTLQATDLHGVSEMLVSAREDFSDTVWLPYATNITVMLPAGDGNKTVFARFKDSNGLVSTVVDDTILLDTQAPVGTVDINDGAGYTNTTVVRLTLTVTDLSGVMGFMVSDRPDFLEATWSAIVERVDYELTSIEGEKTLYLVFRDSLEHVSATATDSIILDMTAPVLSMALEDGATFTSVREVHISFEVIEASGIASVQVGEDPALITAPSTSFQPRIDWTLQPGEGKKTIYARACDLAGNVGPVAAASIVLDTVPPTVTVSIDDGAAYTVTALVSIRITIADQSPIGDMQYGEDPDLSTATTEPFRSPVDVTLSPGDGVKTIYVRVQDAAGNIGPIGSASITLDTTAPTLALSMQEGAPYTRARNVTIALVAADGSGLAQMQLGEDPDLATSAPRPFENSTPWTLSQGDGMKVLYGRVIDLAGNRGPIAQATIVLDTAPPTSAMDPLAENSTQEELTVSWKGVDATTGVALFDVQVSDNGGAWTDLLIGVNSTRTTYKGVDGHYYSFRVRSRDLAGNQEDYPEIVTDIVRIDIPEPSEDFPTGIVLMLVAVVIVLICVGVLYVYSKNRRDDTDPPDAVG